jgi:hypothetical protein
MKLPQRNWSDARHYRSTRPDGATHPPVGPAETLRPLEVRCCASQPIECARALSSDYAATADAEPNSPIGAHAPRSPAPINATRPDFPVRAGLLFLLKNFGFSIASVRFRPRRVSPRRVTAGLEPNPSLQRLRGNAASATRRSWSPRGLAHGQSSRSHSQKPHFIGGSQPLPLLRLAQDAMDDSPRRLG